MQYLHKASFLKYAFYLHVFTSAGLPQVFDEMKNQKIIRKDMKESSNSVLDLLVYSKCPIKWNSGPQAQSLRVPLFFFVTK